MNLTFYTCSIYGLGVASNIDILTKTDAHSGNILIRLFFFFLLLDLVYLLGKTGSFQNFELVKFDT